MSDRRKILVVDDDIDLVEQVCLALSAAGFEVSRAYSEEEGEAALLETIPDAAVIDLMMEDMDSGFVLCHRIKELYPGTPVIILTAVASETGLDFHASTPEEKSWIKADTYLDKPARPEQLVAEVRRLLSLRG